MSGSLLVEIRRRMRRGDSIDDVDLELIERADLSADDKAALWLYAWSLVPRRRQRASARCICGLSARALDARSPRLDLSVVVD